MLLIADSGSTKTQWVVLDDGMVKQNLSTAGINPFFETSDDILKMLKNEFPKLNQSPDSIHFYGAGCANPDINKVVEKALEQYFGSKDIHIKSDLYAAAHSLCQNEEGIACIIGTGSNSCHYDGEKIVDNVSPLGFILGDEGSGAVLGRTLVGDILKKQLDQSLIDAFDEAYKTNAGEIINRVYRQPFPNRYLAEFTKFINEHIQHPQMEALVKDGFDKFVKRNLLQYDNVHQLPISFTGSLAYHFKKQLEDTLEHHNLKLGKIDKTPIEGLVLYHLGKGILK